MIQKRVRAREYQDRSAPILATAAPVPPPQRPEPSDRAPAKHWDTIKVHQLNHHHNNALLPNTTAKTVHKRVGPIQLTEKTIYSSKIAMSEFTGRFARTVIRSLFPLLGRMKHQDHYQPGLNGETISQRKDGLKEIGTFRVLNENNWATI